MQFQHRNNFFYQPRLSDQIGIIVDKPLQPPNGNFFTGQRDFKSWQSVGSNRTFQESSSDCQS